MSDVRALLKAKRQEARVTHPLAAYSASGQLRCTACGTAVKAASSWEGHVGSKAHRVAAARLREEEERRRLAALRLEEPASDDDAQEADEPPHKRKAAEEEGDAEELESKRRRVEELPRPTAAKGGFPADFFSDPAQAPAAWEDADAEDGEGDDAAAAAPPAAPAAVDLEWEKFQQEVLNPPDAEETFQRATVVAEPTVNEDALAGFPPRDDGAEAPQEELTEEQIRQRKEQDERELIMDRLMEEERAQEEADARVTMLKTKLEALRKQREAKKGAKTKKGA